MEIANQIMDFEGIIIEVTDGAVAIDLEGRLGFIKVPKRMVISDQPLEVGQKANLKMSYIETTSQVEAEHVKNLKNYNRREVK